MSENDFSRDPFAILRTAGQAAALPPVDAVRRRGRRRQLRARAGYALTTVALVAGGSSLALATGGHHSPGPGEGLTMTAATDHSTDAPSPSRDVTPTAAPTVSASSTTTASPPSTPPGGDSSTASSTSSGAPSAHLEVVFTRTSPDGSNQLTWRATVTGTVPRLYVSKQADPTSYGYIPGGAQIKSTRVFVDGQIVDGSDGGQMQCKDGAPLVQLAEGPFVRGGAHGGPVVLSPGTHRVVFVANACTVSAQDEFTVTVK
jgi:hypothetical protein